MNRNSFLSYENLSRLNYNLGKGRCSKEHQESYSMIKKAISTLKADLLSFLNCPYRLRTNWQKSWLRQSMMKLFDPFQKLSDQNKITIGCWNGRLPSTDELE